MVSIVNAILCFFQYCEIPTNLFWNINTNEFKNLPLSSLESLQPSYQRVVCTIYGFGYDHVADGHKLIRNFFGGLWIWGSQKNIEGPKYSMRYPVQLAVQFV